MYSYLDEVLVALIFIGIFLFIKHQFGYFNITIYRQAVELEFWEYLCWILKIDSERETQVTLRCHKKYFSTKKFNPDDIEPKC